MLVSYNWLQDFLNLDQEPHALAEKITRTGVEIADIYIFKSVASIKDCGKRSKLACIPPANVNGFQFCAEKQEVV